MTSVAGVFREAAKRFWQWPVLWVPVLLADACGFVVSYGASWAGRLMIAALTPKSVLGGFAGPVNGFSRTALMVGAVIGWAGYAFRIFAYLYALGVVVRAVWRRGGDRPALSFAMPSGLGAALVRVLGWWILAMASVALFSEVASGLVVFAASRPVLGYVMVLPIVLLWIYLVTPTVSAFAQSNATEMRGARRSTDWALLSFAAVAATIVGLLLQGGLNRDWQLRTSTNAAVWFGLKMAVSVLSAVPYAFAFLGIALPDSHVDNTLEQFQGADQS